MCAGPLRANHWKSRISPKPLTYFVDELLKHIVALEIWCLKEAHAYGWLGIGSNPTLASANIDLLHSVGGAGNSAPTLISCTQLLRIRDVYPGSRIPIFTHPVSRISIQKQQQKRGVKKKFIVIPFFVATNFTNLKLILFWNAEEKNVGQFLRIIELFYSTNCH